MTKIITDNSKVNINLLKENELLKKENQKLELDKQALTQQLRIGVVVGSALLKDLLDGSEEVITINGLRFTGTHEEKIKQVFDKHGIKYEIPF